MDVEEAAEATLEGHEDELDKYLALPVEKNTDLDVLAWWKAKDNEKDGLPILAKMARQFLGRPASSAGVERMFLKTRRPNRMGPSSTATLPPPTPSRDEEHARAEQETKRGSAAMQPMG